MRLWFFVFGIWLTTVLPAASQDWAGDWVWSVEDKPAMVLRLDSAGGGEMRRPRHLTMDANAGYWRMIDVGAEIAAIPVTAIRADGDVLSLQAVDPDGDQTDYRLTRVGPDDAELTLADIPAAPMFAMKRAPRPTEVASDWTPGRVYGRPPVVADNADLARLFNEDQAARQGTMGLEVVQQDAARRAAVRRLLDDGQVRSAADHYHAAFIFQHGDRSDDYLLAHALAVAAVARGRDDAAWIAAATLDRYLQSVGRSQIYGTQFQIPRDGSGATQGDYDRALLPDSLRTITGVPPLSAQAEQLRAYDRAD